VQGVDQSTVRRNVAKFGPWLAVVGLLLVVSTLFPLGNATFSDEGQYNLQAQQLQVGDWAVPDYTAPVEPSGELFGVGNTEITENGDRVYYSRHPLWPSLMASLSDLLGADVGQRALSFVGGIGCVAAAYLIALRVGAPRPRSAIWVAALSPVLFWSHLTYAHTFATACFGLGLWCLLRPPIDDRFRSIWPLIVGWSLIGVAIMLRSEALLFAVGVLLVTPLRTRGDRLVPGVVGTVFVATAYFLDAAWRSSINGSIASNLALREPTSFLAGRIEGFIRTFFYSQLAFPADALLMFGIMLSIALMIYGRRRPSFARYGALLAVLSPLLLFASESVAMPVGIFVTWPLVSIGVFLGAQYWWSVLPRWLVASVGIYVGAVLATQYRIAGGEGGDVGARFLMLMAPIGAVTVCFVDWATLGSRLTRLIYCLSILPLVAALTVQSNTPVTAKAVAEFRAIDVGYIVTQNPFLGNFLWQLQSTHPFVYASPDGDRTVEEVASLFEARTDKAVVILVFEASGRSLSDQYCRVAAPESERIGLAVYVTRDGVSIPCG
jgi:hypothetical protein